MLTQHFDEEICDLSGLCSQAFELVPATQLQEGEDIQCEFCEKVVQYWIDVYCTVLYFTVLYCTVLYCRWCSTG